MRLYLKYVSIHLKSQMQYKMSFLLTMIGQFITAFSALLTAYHNAGGEIELESALKEMYKRGKSVPGGACGFWGACGAGECEA